MKKILIFIFALLVCSASVFAQNYRDVVYLKNGSVIKGDVLEQVAGGNIKIKTADGSLFVYPSSDVVKVVKEEVKGGSTKTTRSNAAAAVSDTEQFRGWRFSPGLGLGVTLGDYSFASGAIDLGVGKDISDQVFLGGGLNLAIPFQEKAPVTVGAFFENRIYFPSESKVSFVLRDRLNFGANFEHEAYSLGLSIMPGVMMKLSPKIDLLLSAGYQLGINLKGGGAGHSLAFMGTFDFHNATSGAGKAKNYHPSGLEIGSGFGVSFYPNSPGSSDNQTEVGPMFCLSVGYRFNPRFSLGLELAPTEINFYAKVGKYNEALYYDGGTLGVTARYRFMNKKISPIASLTAGFAVPDGGYGYNSRSVFALLLSPKGGASFRLGEGNGHLEVCAGLGSGFTAPFKFNLKDDNPAQVFSFLRPEITIRYYHTLGVGSKWFNEIEF